MIGILIDASGFELSSGEPIGRRRQLDEPTVAQLEEFGQRYAKLLGAANSTEGLQSLGRDLYRFLDGDSGDLTALIDQSPRPVHFEIVAPTRRPSAAMLALLRAPWELLADGDGFLVGDDRLRFSPIRRLGRPQPAPALDNHRFGLAFMAASPRGVAELDYEAEETAIMMAVGAANLDLLVEDSGNLGQLGDRLAELPLMQALHLSCHGDNAWVSEKGGRPRPVLLLEDEAGGALPVEVGTLIEVFQAKRPHFVFLSACLTAAGSEHQRLSRRENKISMGRSAITLAQSLAESLIDGGISAVLGWDGSVVDRAASSFAASLYGNLARRWALADAVASARRSLLNNVDEVLRGDWHLARLWLGPDGSTGALVAGQVTRNLVPTHGAKEFLTTRGATLPVASHDMFVGRRRELQLVQRVLREHSHSGVLLHGMGRLGKSSLAARIANRRRDLKLVLIFERYSALDIMASLDEALRDNGEARDLVRRGTQKVRENSEHLKDVLIDLLSASCLQSGLGTPILLVIDDVERILEVDSGDQPPRVKHEFSATMRAVLRAFDRRIDSRLLLTSRFPFVLDGLEGRLLALQLPPLSDIAQRKLDLRQRDAAKRDGLQPEEQAARAELLARVREVARGNPGLQDLIGQRIVLARDVSADEAEQVLDEVAQWLNFGPLPSNSRVRDFIYGLGIDALIEIGGKQGKTLLRRLALFDVPIPLPVARVLDENHSLQRLRDLGLVDILEGPFDAQPNSVSVNALVVGRLPPLEAEERAKTARLVAKPLFGAWQGGPGGTPAASSDLLLTRIGLLAHDVDIVAACSGCAVAMVSASNHADAASTLGQAALQLLEENAKRPSLGLLSATASAAAHLGDGALADELLLKGVSMVEQLSAAGVAFDPDEAGFFVHEAARRARTRGDLEAAERWQLRSLEFAIEGRNERNAAVARAGMADILESRGQLDDALRILKEQLPIHERLGDVRSRAVTIGRIANILLIRGQIDEALRIRQEEQLPVYERLGDIGSRAMTLGSIADILVRRGQLEEALRIRQDEELPVYEQLGDVRSRAVTLSGIADILESRGEIDKALRILEEEVLPVYDRLGDVGSRARALTQIATTLERRGDLDGALRILREEVLPVYERLGDVHQRAVTLGRIATVLVAKGDSKSAYAIYEELLEFTRQQQDQEGISSNLWALGFIDLNEGRIGLAVPRIVEAYSIVHRLGRAEGIGAIGPTFGQILLANKRPNEAKTVFRLSIEMLRKLGREAEADRVEDLIAKLDFSASPS